MEKEAESFFSKINKFNEIYKIENNTKPTLLNLDRLHNFKKILLEEVEEINEIIEQYQNSLNENSEIPEEKKIEVLTHVSDWLGDIIVYSASEARRFGVDINKILDIIMDSNFSKLDESGNPIHDERGKILKGPNYWKPEPKIQEFLRRELER